MSNFFSSGQIKKTLQEMLTEKAKREFIEIFKIPITDKVVTIIDITYDDYSTNTYLWCGFTVFEDMALAEHENREVNVVVRPPKRYRCGMMFKREIYDDFVGGIRKYGYKEAVGYISKLLRAELVELKKKIDTKEIGQGLPKSAGTTRRVRV
jgi:hypothetical protein